MMNSLKKVICVLLFFICILDFLSYYNTLLNIAAGLLSSYIVFLFGTQRLKLDKKKYVLLLTVNIVVLLITAPYRIYLINMLLLSYLIWSVITPVLVKYTRFFIVAIAAAFLPVYLLSMSQITAPIFCIVYYPIYIIGYLLANTEFKKSEVLGTILLNILFTFSILIILFYKVRNLSIIESVTFIRLYNPSAQAASYLPVITVLFLWLSVSTDLLIYIYSNTYKNSLHHNELSEDHAEAVKSCSLKFICFILVIGSIMFISEYTLRRQIVDTLKALFTPQIMFNFIFLSIIYLMLISILGRGLATAFLFTAAFLLISGNFIKIRFFNEPFYPWDIYLIKNAFFISKKYIDFKIILLMIFFLFIFIYIIIKFRQYFKKALKPRLNVYLLPVASCLTIFNILIMTNFALLSNIGINKSWYTGKEEILANGCFVQNYFYLSDFNRYVPSKPQDYSYDKMNEIDNKLAQRSTPQTKNIEKPDIVVVMSESFWDPTQLKGVTFNKEITKNLKKYQTGKIVSPVFGGATANTEFEALTGMSMYFMNYGIIPYNVYLRRDTPSIVTALKDSNYSTTAIHPNTGEFYNRNLVYKYFGFDAFIDINGFNKNKDVKGVNISDEKVIDKIASVLNKNTDKPKFVFAVTMQNHDPYYENYKNLEIRAKSDMLDKVETSILSNYAQGIYDADKSLGKLIDTLEKSSKPTLVYFFGDHLPRLGENDTFAIYNKLGYFNGVENVQRDISLYETPLVMWSNYKEIKPLGGSVSPAQIAYEILKNSQVKYPDYFNILNELRADHSSLHKIVNKDVNLDSENIRNYKLIQYDLLFGEQYLKSFK